VNKYYTHDEETTMTTEPIEPDNRSARVLLLILIGTALLFAAGLLYFHDALSQTTARTATISFTAPTTRTDGSTITGTLSYEVWQGLKGGTKAKAGTINNTTTTITTGLQGGREYCWYVIVVEAGFTSVPSNEACKAFDLSSPNTVTITVT
jgi:hypothetical protein